MSRFPVLPALALLGLALVSCSPATTMNVPPTATATSPTTPTATPTATPLLAPTPTAVPTGWGVLDTGHFSLAYPSGWTAKRYSPDAPYPVSPFEPHAPFTTYVLLLPNGAASALRVFVLPQVQGPDEDAYCRPASANRRPLMFAGLPMAYKLSGEGSLTRSWLFINTRGTAYLLEAGDADADAATQAQDEAILATFRPDIADPLTC